MSKKISIYIQDMIDNMNSAIQFISGVSQDTLINDKKTYYALLDALKSLERLPKGFLTK